ncbi:hypothetical protein SAMN04487820_106203 [Actinopolyspora mzabensis]|uniref:Uncharacterized protein n=1 Tax=Actinopolyspora mzabensis TaxID=995066 RepID=A0A1G9AT12_ACTMZ|nr:hypothetical protein SAMN04487820_106203 [Actinopolyspora mzabensis]
MSPRPDRLYLGRHGFRPCRLPEHMPVLSGDLTAAGTHHPTRSPGSDRHDTSNRNTSRGGAVLSGWSLDRTTLARILAGLRAL